MAPRRGVQDLYMCQNVYRIMASRDRLATARNVKRGPRPRGRTKASQFDGSVRPLRYVSGGGWASARQPGSPYYVRQSPRVRARTGSDLSGPALGFTITVSCPTRHHRTDGRTESENTRLRTALLLLPNSIIGHSLLFLLLLQTDSGSARFVTPSNPFLSSEPRP